jgi:hypothetical protein
MLGLLATRAHRTSMSDDQLSPLPIAALYTAPTVDRATGAPVVTSRGRSPR